MYRKPDGEETSMLGEYLDAWADMNEQIELVLGAKVVAFDPDVQIQCEGLFCSLPLWLAKKIKKLQPPT